MSFIHIQLLFNVFDTVSRRGQLALLITQTKQQTYCSFFHYQRQKAFRRAMTSSSIKSPSNKNLSTSPNSTLVFTPVHNQTVLCPVPPYGPSTMKPACCCRGLTRCGHSERGERGAAARGGPRNTGPFPARGAPPWAAAPSGPWGTRVEQERTDHSPRPSSLYRSSWKWEECLEGWNQLLYQLCFSVRSYEEWLGSAWSSSVISKPRGRSHGEIWQLSVESADWT